MSLSHPRGSENRSPFTRIVALISAFAMTLALAIIGAVAGASTAAAAAPLQCDGTTVYLVNAGGDVRAFDSTTMTIASSNAATGLNKSGRNSNALGIADGGGTVFTSDNNATKNDKEVRVYTMSNGDQQHIAMPDGGDFSGMLRGAVNPATGVYYYSAGDVKGKVRLGAYDPAGNAGPITVGNITGMSGANGDFAFTSSGKLVIVADANIYSLDGTVPTTAGTGDLPTTLIGTMGKDSSGKAPLGNGIAFGSQGKLYISTSGSVIEADPSDGKVLRTTTSLDGFKPVDMASCGAYPSTLTLQINVNGDRANPTDQFSLEVGGQSYLPDARKNTTTGTASGIQSEAAGPLTVKPGDSFDLSYGASGSTDLADYPDATIECVDAANNNAAVAVTGTAPNWKVQQPSGTTGSDVICTVTVASQAAAPAPAISLVKTNDFTGSALVEGDKVTYTFVITNTGNTNLVDLKLADPLKGLSAFSPALPASLAAGASFTTTATYTITAADVAAGTVHNTATTTGTPADKDGNALKGQDKVTDTDDTWVPAEPKPAISLVKSNDFTGSSLTEGDKVTYTFVITNTGGTNLIDIKLADPLKGLSAFSPKLPASLAPGESFTTTATYTITADDAEVGRVENIATTTGTPADKDGKALKDKKDVTDSDSSNVPAAARPAISLKKTNDAKRVLTEGDQVTYTFVIKNVGNTNLVDITLNDPHQGLSAFTPPLPASLAVGESFTTQATYTITADDVKADNVLNRATVKGTPANKNGKPTGQKKVTDEDTSNVLVAPPNPSIDLEKSANKDSVSKAGDVVTYQFTVTNSGNVTLSEVQIRDRMKGLGAIVYSWPNPSHPGILEPGEQATATATYTVTQADIDAGTITNGATVVAVTPQDLEIEIKPKAKGADEFKIEVLDATETVGPKEELSNTGVETWQHLGLALLLVAAGGALVFVARRRHGMQ